MLRGLEGTVHVVKSALSSWTPITEFLVVAITVPTAVVLAVWLGIALGLSPVWSQVVVTILVLGLVLRFMLKSMRSSMLQESDDTPFTAQTNPVQAVPNNSETQD